MAVEADMVAGVVGGMAAGAGREGRAAVGRELRCSCFACEVTTWKHDRKKVAYGYTGSEERGCVWEY